MDLSHRGGQGAPDGLTGWLLNLLPSLGVGAAAYFGLARALVGSGGSPNRWRTHLLRTAALYVVALGFGILMLHDGSNPDFWRFGQLVLWPWATAVGGIAADAIMASRVRDESRP